MSERVIKQEISKWEQNLAKYQINDIEKMYDQWIEKSLGYLQPSTKSKLSHGIDDILFHTHAYLQGSVTQKEAREKIINTAKIFDPTISEINDLKGLSIDQLTYIAQQHIATSKLQSMVQGGLTGAGGRLFIGIDLPLMIILNLRIVQLIGLTFGHEINSPYEMMLSLKVFYAATVPKRFQYEAWMDLKVELDEAGFYLYEGNEKLTDRTVMYQATKQVLKNLMIVMGRKKLIQGVPIVSIGIGVVSNHQLTRQVANFALKFNQLRKIEGLGC